MKIIMKIKSLDTNPEIKGESKTEINEFLIIFKEIILILYLLTKVYLRLSNIYFLLYDNMTEQIIFFLNTYL